MSEPAELEFTEAIYNELRSLAARKLSRERAGHTLQATALVHEVFLKLRPRWNDFQNHTSRELVLAAAQAMQRILIDRARARKRLKRVGAAKRADLSLNLLPARAELDVDLEVLQQALAEFEAIHAEKAQLVRIRYFAGQTIETACRLLDISKATAERWWNFSKAWLFRRIDELNQIELQKNP